MKKGIFFKLKFIIKGGCANVTDEMFEKICKECTKLKIVDVAGCPSIYSYAEILRVIHKGLKK